MSVPTLLVGLGGAGLKIVNRVYENANKNASEDQKKNIAYVVFDTDVNELLQIAESKKNIHTIQVSARMTVGEYLKYDDNARNKWFPVNDVLNSKVLTEGAGQVRAISRLAFNTALVQGKLAPLDDAIKELYTLRGDALEQVPRVIVTGSLCGGTGSGLALPVCMYIRNYLQTKLQQGAALIRGFFLLPEVFFNVIKGTSEQNNLRCNAYAAIREIDAFMRKADSNLPPDYNLHFTIPRVNSKIEDEYTGRPMDFCFLFDNQSLSGGQLHSMADYYSHAANCIFSMAIAPTSSRSNSSEDNVLRDIIREGGRNRYAGAGTSVLQYPTDDVKKYLGLRWTMESISKEWTEIDQRFKSEIELNKDRKKAGFTEQAIDRGDHFISVMSEGVAQYHPFSKAIHDMCMKFSDENKTIVEKDLWTLYLKDLEGYIENCIMQEKKKLEKMEKRLNANRANIAEKKGSQEDKQKKEDSEVSLSSNFEKWFTMIIAYRDSTIKYVEELSRNLIFTLFRDTKDYTKTENSFRIEYWLQQGHNPEKFFHPSAVRYMLYNVLKSLNKSLTRKEKSALECRKSILDFSKIAFDDLETNDTVETREEYAERAEFNAEGFRRFLKRGLIDEKKNILITRFDEMMKNVNTYWVDGVFAKVYSSAVVYLNQLAQSYEMFFDALQNNCVVVDEEIKQMERMYEIRDGIPMRYVCADKECLRKMAEEVSNPNDSLDLPGSLCATIYSELRRFVMEKARNSQKAQEEDSRTASIAADRFCAHLFNETIVKHQEKRMEEQYGGLIHMDVLSALEKEAKYKLPEEEKKDSNQIRIYMTHVLDSTKKLAAPFIESPRDKEARVIAACTYNENLDKPVPPIPGRKEFVEKYLAGNSVTSADINPNTVLFYQAVYDLRARDLGKFAPSDKTETTDRQAGDYYKAYHELIAELHPLPQISRAVTPHLDRWWHVVTKLPELSDESQQEQEKEITRAFLWGLIGKYVLFRKDPTTNRQSYSIAKSLCLQDRQNLIVSNGTVCDRLYELLDAFTIYPHLVKTVKNKADLQIDRDLVNKVPLKFSYLYKALGDFCCDEIPLEKEEKTVTVDENGQKTEGKKPNINATRSIFELPLLMKRSVPTDEYRERIMDQLISSIFDELYSYHKRFCAEKDLLADYSAFLMDQFNLLKANVSIDAKKYPDLKLLEEPLLDDILERLETEVSEKGVPDHAEKIRKLRINRMRYGNRDASAFEE